MEIMSGMSRIWRSLLLVSVVGMAGVVFAQDSPETTAPVPNAPAVEPDVAAEVQRLRSELDRLKREVQRLNSVVEQLESERAETAEAAAAAPVQTAPTAPVATASGATSAAGRNAKGKKPVHGASRPTVVATTAPATNADDIRTQTTVLVFHDGHKVEAQNYAIVGQTLWIYTAQDSKRVPLAELDVAATKSANSDRGVTFQLPPTN